MSFNTYLDLNSNNNTQAPERITTGPYIYRAIATNLEISNLGFFQPSPPI
jgi:hypothetical protein